MTRSDREIIRIIRTTAGPYPDLEKALPGMSEMAKMDLARLLDTTQQHAEADGRRRGRREFGRIY